MLFRLLADATFEADDIDDALTQLSKHFADVIGSSFQFVGSLEIKPEEKKDETFESQPR